MKIKRTWFAADKSGFHILHTLFQTSLKYASIERFDEYFAIDLLVDDGRCQGVVAIEMRSGRLCQFQAKAVILATGGAGRMFPFTTNGAIKTGDGMAMAYRAGVPPKDMEFVQYHPTGLPAHRHPAHRGLPRRGRRPAQQGRLPLPAGLRPGTGDPAGRAGAQDHGARAARPPEPGLLARAAEGQHRTDPVGRERAPGPDATWARRRSTSGCRWCASCPSPTSGVDPVTDPVPIRPVVHYMMGGIHTDIDAATPMPGLYAVGEMACVSLNGANRLGSNSLTELLVFGKRAAANAIEYARSAESRQ